MPAHEGPTRHKDEVETLLTSIRQWLQSEGPTPSTHPDASELAAYVDWLADGAPGDCPVPQVQEHTGDCQDCYRKVDTLLIAHLSAERDPARPPLGAFVLDLAHGLGDATIEWTDELGQSVRQVLAGHLHVSAAYLSSLMPVRDPDSIYELDYARPPAPRLASRARSANISTGKLALSNMVRASRRGFDLMLVVRHRETQAPLPNLRVRLRRDTGDVLYTETTDAQGQATFSRVSPQRYRIEISP